MHSVPAAIRPRVGPDVELLVINFLNAQQDFADMQEEVTFSNDVPYFQTMAANAAYGRVIGGEGLTSRFVAGPVVDIDIFSPTYDLSVKVGLIVENLMLYMLFGARYPEGTVQKVREISRPHWIPDENQDLVRYSATYEVRAR